MIDKKFIKKIVQSVLGKSLQPGDHDIMHPEREWYIGLGVAVVILGIGSYWCVQLYFAYSNVESTPANLSTEQTVYREKEVAQALSELSTRKAKQEQLRKNLEHARVDTPDEQSIIVLPENLNATSSATTTNLTEIETTTSTENSTAPTDVNPKDETPPLTPEPR